MPWSVSHHTLYTEPFGHRHERESLPGNVDHVVGNAFHLTFSSYWIRGGWQVTLPVLGREKGRDWAKNPGWLGRESE